MTAKTGMPAAPGTSLEAFLETAWNEHAERPEDVADWLGQSLHLVQVPADIPPYTRLVTHVFGEHLGQWGRGIALLESLRSLPAFDGSSGAAGALTRSVATLRYTSGDCAVLDALSAEDRVSALAGAAAAFTGRNAFDRALTAYAGALDLADACLPAGSPAIRALAVGGNNLAAALEEKKDRDSTETRGMIVAAEAALKYWKQAGSWLEEERAEYRLTRSLLAAGLHPAAIRSARRCVDICERNCAPAFEQFFGYAVLALAQGAAGDVAAFEASRTRALQLFEQVPVEERKWCETERVSLLASNPAVVKSHA
jgi:hypothetical protein